MRFLLCDAWERPGSVLTGGGAPARETPGDFYCPGDSHPVAGESTEEERRHTVYPGPLLDPFPGSVVTSEAAGPGNKKAFTGRALETWGLHCPHPA